MSFEAVRNFDPQNWRTRPIHSVKGLLSYALYTGIANVIKHTIPYGSFNTLLIFFAIVIGINQNCGFGAVLTLIQIFTCGRHVGITAPNILVRFQETSHFISSRAANDQFFDMGPSRATSIFQDNIWNGGGMLKIVKVIISVYDICVTKVNVLVDLFAS